VDARPDPTTPDVELDALVMNLKDIAKRSVFVIDRSGVVRHREVLDDARNEPNYEKVKQTLASL